MYIEKTLRRPKEWFSVMKYNIVWLFVLLLLVGCQAQDPLLIEEHAEVVGDEVLNVPADEPMDGQWVTYGDNFRGYFVKPNQEGTFPGVVMIHEWWGLNQNIKNMAHDMAQEGYLVLAVDLFNGNVADNAGDARTYSSAVRDNMDVAITHLKSATSYLREQDAVAVASMGWCFGGGMSMQLALEEDMDATVIYYGAVETDDDLLSSISWPVLGIFGEVDTVIPLDSVQEFDLDLDNLGIENEIYVYEGLGHAFANPSNPGHDVEKTADAWMKTIDFLNRHLKSQS